MMTAYREETAELVTRALSHNADACLYKPFDLKEVLTLLSLVQERRPKAV
jgi:DNA-binding response OmpR family regulator